MRIVSIHGSHHLRARALVVVLAMALISMAGSPGSAEVDERETVRSTEVAPTVLPVGDDYDVYHISEEALIGRRGDHIVWTDRATSEELSLLAATPGGDPLRSVVSASNDLSTILFRNDTKFVFELWRPASGYQVEFQLPRFGYPNLSADGTVIFDGDQLWSIDPFRKLVDLPWLPQSYSSDLSTAVANDSNLGLETVTHTYGPLFGGPLLTDRPTIALTLASDICSSCQLTWVMLSTTGRFINAGLDTSNDGVETDVQTHVWLDTETDLATKLEVADGDHTYRSDSGLAVWIVGADGAISRWLPAEQRVEKMLGIQHVWDQSEFGLRFNLPRPTVSPDGSELAFHDGDRYNLAKAAAPLSPPAGANLPMVADADSVEEIVGSIDYNRGSHAEVLRLYQAIFAREPDVGGAQYWIDINNQNYGVIEIAGFMSDSDEWANNYEGTTDAQFVETVYDNVLGRNYDQTGFNYWLDFVRGTNVHGGNPDLATLKRHQMVFYVTANPEFRTTYPFQPL